MTCGFERNTSPTHTEFYYCCALERTSCLSGNTELADDDYLTLQGDFDWLVHRIRIQFSFKWTLIMITHFKINQWRKNRKHVQVIFHPRMKRKRKLQFSYIFPVLYFFCLLVLHYGVDVLHFMKIRYVKKVTFLSYFLNYIINDFLTVIFLMHYAI